MTELCCTVAPKTRNILVGPRIVQTHGLDQFFVAKRRLVGVPEPWPSDAVACGTRFSVKRRVQRWAESTMTVRGHKLELASVAEAVLSHDVQPTKAGLSVLSLRPQPENRTDNEIGRVADQVSADS